MTDFEGHLFKSFQPHEGRVTSVCVEGSGRYVASCGVDKSVSVVHLEDLMSVFRLVTTHPVYSVALHPLFAAKSEAPVVYGA